MIRIGLTGSIGMGKSTIAAMFEAEGVPVFDADAVVHDLYRSGAPGARAVAAFFPDALASDGSVDRMVLSARLKKPEAMKVLEGAIHPLVGAARERFLTRAKADGAFAVIFDVPLLFETGLDRTMDLVVVVSAPETVQRERVLARSDMTFEKFEEILKRQLPDADKRARADVVIDTAPDLETTRKQVHDIVARLRTGDPIKRIGDG